MSKQPDSQFKTIVVVTDLGDAQPSTLRYAQELARVHKATLVVTHALDPVAYAYPEGPTEEISRNKEALGEWKQIEGAAVRDRFEVRSPTECGEICDRILRSVEENHADLLVLGTRAKTAVGRAALGVIARRLLARTRCPILAVSPESEKHLPLIGCWRRVLIATDYSLASLAALSYAHRVAYEMLVVVHVSDHLEPHDRLAQVARLRFLAPFNESHTVPIEHVVLTGDPGKIIAERANEFHADLVVLGSPVRELGEEDFATSTVLAVISQARCPVLCVPSVLGLDDSSYIGGKKSDAPVCNWGFLPGSHAGPVAKGAEHIAGAFVHDEMSFRFH